jgi:hypothetical protein
MCDFSSRAFTGSIKLKVCQGTTPTARQTALRNVSWGEKKFHVMKPARIGGVSLCVMHPVMRDIDKPNP